MDRSNRKHTLFGVVLGVLFAVCLLQASGERTRDKQLARTILQNDDLDIVLRKAKAILKTGFNAGDGYSAIFIRDLNTFIELGVQVHEYDVLADRLARFFVFQSGDNHIQDVYYYPKMTTDSDPYDPDRMGRATVETDQETSLVQAICKLVHTTGNRSVLDMVIEGKSVLDRMDLALNYLVDHRWSEQHGLVWGATTVDWGDVQPEAGVNATQFRPGVSHRAIDIYDNAMLVVALQQYLLLIEKDREKHTKWTRILSELRKSIREHLWDKQRQKFIPHLYLESSPFPHDFDENNILYHGGTAVAIEADLLCSTEILESLKKMRDNVKASGCATIGLTCWPCYPDGFFHGGGMERAFVYQNGGDWTWFGGRMVRQLIRHGYVADAYREMLPMVQRVIDNDGFYEWYDQYNKPRGSGTFRGSAGVLGMAIKEIQEWAESVGKE
jgi:hypothetical protein